MIWWNAVVDGAVAVGLVVPRLQAPRTTFSPVALHARSRRSVVTPPQAAADGAGLERVAGLGAAEGQLDVRVHVDAAGDHVLARRRR